MHAVDDEPFDGTAVEAGLWPLPYGPGDVLGTYHEVTAAKRAAALALLDPARGVRTLSLADELFEGYPAFGERPLRLTLVGSGFANGPAATTGRQRPWGPNRLTSLEERVTTSFNLGAKVNGLAHCGVGDRLYGDRSLAAFVAAGGRDLDTTTFAEPLVTRGLLFDMLGFYLAHERTDALARTPDDEPVLCDNHRITVEDLEACATWSGIGPIEAGDAVLMRTGWRRLVRSDPKRYLGANPGVYLREVRWLAQFRPALVGADSWCFETIDPAVTGAQVTPCHQELFVRFGIRLGEGLALDALAEAQAYRFVLVHAPLPVQGAISSNAPPVALF